MEDSAATAAAASSRGTPGWGVILKQASRSVSTGLYSGIQYVSRYSFTPAL